MNCIFTTNNKQTGGVPMTELPQVIQSVGADILSMSRAVTDPKEGLGSIPPPLSPKYLNAWRGYGLIYFQKPKSFFFPMRVPIFKKFLVACLEQGLMRITKSLKKEGPIDISSRIMTILLDLLPTARDVSKKQTTELRSEVLLTYRSQGFQNSLECFSHHKCFFLEIFSF